jgi:hypothetical protein
VKKFLLWTFGILALVLGVLFLFFKEEMIIIGNINSLQSDYENLSEEFVISQEIFAERTDSSSIGFEADKNTAGLLILAHQGDIKECYYKIKAIESIDNPAMIEGLLLTDFYKNDLCFGSKSWYLEVLTKSKESPVNTLSMLRESGIKSPESDFSKKLDKLIGTIDS